MSISSIFSSPALTKLTSNSTVQKIASDLGNESKLLPVILLEAAVTSGRTYQAWARSTTPESRYYTVKETFLEEVMAAAVWFWGVSSLNKVADFVFKKALNIDTTLDWYKINDIAAGRLNPEKFKSLTRTAKLAKLLFATSLAVFTVGVLIPKFKQKLTNDGIEKQKKAKQKPAVNFEMNPVNNPPNLAKPITMQNTALPKNIRAGDLKSLSSVSFGGKELSSNPKTNNPVSFTGVADPLTRIGFAIENEAIPRLLVVDTGITGGRVKSARNKDEALEFLFRDAASLAFYFYSVPLTAKILASKFDKKLGINTLLDSKVVNQLTDSFHERIKDMAKLKNGVIGVEDIKAALVGTSNENVTKVLKEALTANKGALSPQQIKTAVESLDDVLAKALSQVGNLPESQFINIIKSDPILSKGIIDRAFDVAKAQSHRVASNHAVNLSNLLDELVKTSAGKSSEIAELANNIKTATHGIYGNVQSGGIITNENISGLEKLVEKLKGAKVDKAVMDKADEALAALKQSHAAVGNITKETLTDVVKGGMAGDRRFVDKLTALIHDGIKDPTRYIKPAEREHVQSTIKTYAERFVKELEKAGAIKPGEKINIDKVDDVIKNTIQKTKNKHIVMRTLYLLAGLGIGAFFLGWFIPKMQVWITQIRTGSSTFPGVAGLLEGEQGTKPSSTGHGNKAVAAQPLSAPVQYNTGSEAFNAFLKQYKK